MATTADDLLLPVKEEFGKPAEPIQQINVPFNPAPRCIDWRTIDPSTIRGEAIPVEELQFYVETLDKLLQMAPGRYVLISGRQVVAFFDDLDSAAEFATSHYSGKIILIKKIVATEPIPSLESGVIERVHPTACTIG
jgi:hypothetical protein